MTKYSALIISDDLQLQASIKMALAPLDFEAVVVTVTENGLYKTIEGAPDFVFLDIAMLTWDGWQICQVIHEMTDASLIVISEYDDEADMVRGLELGADAFLVKPLSKVELRARVKAISRRVRPYGNKLDTTIVERNGLIIDRKKHLISYQGQSIRLSETEYSLLTCLVKYRRTTVPLEHLYAQGWGSEYGVDESKVHLYISYLRKKLDACGMSADLIHNEYGIGYRFD